MALRITHRRMSPGGTRNEHITHVKWRGDAGEGDGSATTAQMVDYIDNRGHSAYVVGPNSRSTVQTVHPPGAAAYLRTVANGVEDDNLLSLPLY
ncbi:DUF3892 domain-containing protein [Rhodococcus qingshengii]|nr:hypothetical protein EN35_32790 [Rhodococcus qingshengii]